MDNVDVYTRQEEVGLILPQRVTIAGCGGVGSWASILLAMSGVKHITLYDPDIVEIHNLNRCLFKPEDIGQKKAMVLREVLIQLRPKAIVIAMSVPLLAGFITKDMEVVVDCTDDWKTQRELYLACTNVGIDYLRIGYNGMDSFTITNHVPSWHNDGDDNEERYAFVPSWSAPAALAAALGIMKLLKYNAMEVKGVLSCIK